MRIRFLSKNKYKIEEATAILGPTGVEVIPVTLPINELQTDNMELLVRDKTLRAFGQLGHRLFVEQTGLSLEALGGFPNGLTQLFWDTVGADRMCQLFGRGEPASVIARTRIGYCDGKRVFQFEGEISGRIADTPRGDRSFQWDCVFVPDGRDETFAEMGTRKNDISMRRLALDKLAAHLRRREDA